MPLTTRRRNRFRLASAVFGVASCFAVLAGTSAYAESAYFRIGTGASGGTYFPIGGLIANAVSNPPGSRPCDRGGSCGVPGLIAVAVSTQGSVENVDAVAKGDLESGLSQSDIAHWAYHGTGIYRNKGKATTLRAIANLYPESLHLVVRRDAGIEKVGDLKGKRVSVGPEESGTRVHAGIVLEAHGLKIRDIVPHYLRPGPAGDMLRAGKIDAFFFVAGYPAPAIAALADDIDIALIGIDTATVARIRSRFPFFSGAVIPAGVYRGVGETWTLSVGALWIVSANVDAEIVYGLTRALWHENTRRLLDRGHNEGKKIRLETALEGISIPLHPGAERYYREVGVLPE